ncbi:hypothetical protein H6G83_01900 [Anabaena azotica FACHB-119]|uniref:Uncharacterized protein n=1 Tax=Anabaena azotica FACHB-119 TaxID=947527 RepID=A0ABR8CWT6_9NOST|nr:hypothetical protein [Anabaena azotica FACHB-119]
MTVGLSSATDSRTDKSGDGEVGGVGGVGTGDWGLGIGGWELFNSPLLRSPPGRG